MDGGVGWGTVLDGVRGWRIVGDFTMVLDSCAGWGMVLDGGDVGVVDMGDDRGWWDTVDNIVGWWETVVDNGG